ncbi:MAG: hypothetical protein OEZ22_01090 [Spirochaetia bacterium]|nr:hypothetical protein [Spirochaetia bacterium]
MKKMKTLYVCKKSYKLFFIFFLFFLINNIYPQKNNDVIAEFTCSDLGTILNKKNNEIKLLKNKIFLCKGVITEIFENFSELPDELISKSRWISKLDKPYLLKLRPVEEKLKNSELYLFSSKEEIVEVLKPNLEIEFSGQLIFLPFVNKNMWRIVFLNQEAALKVE